MTDKQLMNMKVTDLYRLAHLLGATATVHITPICKEEAEAEPTPTEEENSMKIYRFDGKEWPYTATICAESAEQAKEFYCAYVCDPDGEWPALLPMEITRDAALENMPDDQVLTGQTAEEYLDEMLSSGATNLIAIDSALV